MSRSATTNLSDMEFCFVEDLAGEPRIWTIRSIQQAFVKTSLVVFILGPFLVKASFSGPMAPLKNKATKRGSPKNWLSRIPYFSRYAKHHFLPQFLTHYSPQNLHISWKMMEDEQFPFEMLLHGPFSGEKIGHFPGGWGEGSQEPWKSLPSGCGAVIKAVAAPSSNVGGSAVCSCSAGGAAPSCANASWPSNASCDGHLVEGWWDLGMEILGMGFSLPSS